MSITLWWSNCQLITSAVGFFTLMTNFRLSPPLCPHPPNPWQEILNRRVEMKAKYAIKTCCDYGFMRMVGLKHQPIVEIDVLQTSFSIHLVKKAERRLRNWLTKLLVTSVSGYGFWHKWISRRDIMNTFDRKNASFRWVVVKQILDGRDQCLHGQQMERERDRYRRESSGKTTLRTQGAY